MNLFFLVIWLGVVALDEGETFEHGSLLNGEMGLIRREREGGGREKGVKRMDRKTDRKREREGKGRRGWIERQTERERERERV